MCLFIETIRIEEGRIYNLPYHNLRLNETRRNVFGNSPELDLAGCLHPEEYMERTRCRVEYGESICKIEFAPYRIRPVRSLRLVYCDEADYRYKSVDRACLNNLFAKRNGADDILVVRNGLVTDTSICNVAFWNGSCWVTPAQPLLCGTKRASLLEAGILTMGDISAEALDMYLSVRLFNAMIDFGEVELDVSCINR